MNVIIDASISVHGIQYSRKKVWLYYVYGSTMQFSHNRESGKVEYLRKLNPGESCLNAVLASPPA